MKKSILISTILLLVLISLNSCVKTCGCESMIQPQPPNNGGNDNISGVVYMSDVIPSGVREVITDGRLRIYMIPELNYSSLGANWWEITTHQYYGSRNDTIFVSGAKLPYTVAIDGGTLNTVLSRLETELGVKASVTNDATHGGSTAATVFQIF